jgi:hypothetical protein
MAGKTRGSSDISIWSHQQEDKETSISYDPHRLMFCVSLSLSGSVDTIRAEGIDPPMIGEDAQRGARH